MSQTVIVCFGSTEAAHYAMPIMKKADPSIRMEQKRATIIVKWHSNIIAASMALNEAGLHSDMIFINDIL